MSMFASRGCLSGIQDIDNIDSLKINNKPEASRPRGWQIHILIKIGGWFSEHIQIFRVGQEHVSCPNASIFLDFGCD